MLQIKCIHVSVFILNGAFKVDVPDLTIIYLLLKKKHVIWISVTMQGKLGPPPNIFLQKSHKLHLQSTFPIREQAFLYEWK